MSIFVLGGTPEAQRRAWSFLWPAPNRGTRPDVYNVWPTRLYAIRRQWFAFGFRSGICTACAGSVCG